mgnify:CR=1 FL=1
MTRIKTFRGVGEAGRGVSKKPEKRGKKKEVKRREGRGTRKETGTDKIMLTINHDRDFIQNLNGKKKPRPEKHQILFG